MEGSSEQVRRGKLLRGSCPAAFFIPPFGIPRSLLPRDKCDTIRNHRRPKTKRHSYLELIISVAKNGLATISDNEAVIIESPIGPGH